MNKRVLRVASALNVLIYRLSRGKLLGRFPSGAPVCLLKTKGRKSGRSRTVPLLYLADGNTPPITELPSPNGTTIAFASAAQSSTPSTSCPLRG